MKHGSLFSGIGGFDLAAEWMGWENIFHCEFGEDKQKQLHKIFFRIVKCNLTYRRLYIVTGKQIGRASCRERV